MSLDIRTKKLNTHTYTSGNIGYWCEGSFRVGCNYALETARMCAKKYDVDISVIATVDQKYQHENVRQLVFLVSALQDIDRQYQSLEIPFFVEHGSTYDLLREYISSQKIGLLVVSASYTTFFSDIQKQLAQDLDIPVILVDDNSYLPVWHASEKEEYAAYTLRKKYWKKVADWKDKDYTLYSYSDSIMNTKIHASGLQDVLNSRWYQDVYDRFGDGIVISGGESEAQKKWSTFVEELLHLYSEDRNNPNKKGTSFLSAYLHFGCISPIQIFQELQQILPEMQDDAFTEELFVRRELAINMWYYNDHHADWRCLPDWVLTTLDEQQDWRRAGRNHKGEPVQPSLDGLGSDEYRYTFRELADAETHDELWNAAQNQLLQTGKIHGYVRMYWGKQIITWFDDWREAYDVAVRLNDTFAVDGASPNGYTGVAWCFGKHDRPFPPKKPYFGIVRSMKMSGMKKKFDVDTYIQEWS